MSTEGAITKKAVLDRLWAELDRQLHQTKSWDHCQHIWEGTKHTAVVTDVRACRDCKTTVRIASDALRGLSFTVREARP